MDKICAVVDAQGFMLNKKFIPKELAIHGNNIQKTVYFNKPENQLNFREQFMVNYQTKNVHHIPYEAKGDFETNNINVILKMWHLFTATKEKPFFACKNPQLYSILKKCDIPAIFLNSAPTLKEMNNIYYDGCQHLRCARKKTLYLWRWICSINNIPFENPFNCRQDSNK